MLPRALNPMLAQKAEAPFDSAEHIFEIKWDGIRCLARIDAGQVRLQSRHHLEITVQFPELACLARLPSGTILDGELVVLRQGKPSFQAVQRRALLQHRSRIQWVSQTMPATYMVFDVLYLKGKPLIGSPLSHRRESLENLLRRFLMPGVHVVEGVRARGYRLFAQVVRRGLEGVVAKRLDSPYLPGKRSRYWLKIKPTTRSICRTEHHET